MWVYRTCSLEDATCGNATFISTNFTSNTAVGGGGGAFFTYEAAHVSYTCNATGNTLVDQAAAALGTTLTLGCGTAWYGNNGTYVVQTHPRMDPLRPHYRSIDLTLCVSLQVRTVHSWRRRRSRWC